MLRLNASLAQRALYVALTAVGAGSVVGGIDEGEWPADLRSLVTALVLTVAVGLVVRVMRLRVLWDGADMVEHGLLRSRRFRVSALEKVDVAPYAGLLVRGSPSKQWCVLRVTTTGGRQHELVSIVGSYRSRRLREFAQELSSHLPAP